MTTREDGQGRVYAEAIVEAGPFCEWDLCLAPFAGPPRRGCGSPYLHVNGTWVGPAPTDEPAPHADVEIDRVSTLRGSILPVPIDNVSLFTSVSPDAFAALPRLSHAEIQAALDKGRAEAFPDHHPLAAAAPREPSATVAYDPDWTPEERASRLGCLYGAATIGRCGEPVGKGKRYCGKHGRHEPPARADDRGADLTRPSPDRAAWLLHPVSSTGRETIATEQYEELRSEAVALRDSVAELEAEVAKERAASTGANTAWSRAVVLQEQAQDERDAAIARAKEAARKLLDVAELQRSTAADLDTARAQLRLVSAGQADVWRWQGDGHDDPASLACPVVMSPATLREFVAAREWAATLGAPTPLDLAVAEVCALPVEMPTFYASVDSVEDGLHAVDMLIGDHEMSRRDRLAKIARVALAGMLACAPADGGKEPG